MIATAAPVLLVHYAPGMLVVLRREPCKGQRGAWGIQHSTCPCDKKDKTLYLTAGLHLLQGDEQAWCLERSWIPREAPSSRA